MRLPVNTSDNIPVELILGPSLDAIIFVSADVVALVIQAIGGGMASAAAQSGTGNPNKGGHVMLIGIVIQLVAITVYAGLAGSFLLNLRRNKAVRAAVPSENTSADSEKARIEGYGAGSGVLSGRMKLMIAGLAFSTLCLFIRSIYRTIELRSVGLPSCSHNILICFLVLAMAGAVVSFTLRSTSVSFILSYHIARLILMLVQTSWTVG